MEQGQKKNPSKRTPESNKKNETWGVQKKNKNENGNNKENKDPKVQEPKGEVRTGIPGRETHQECQGKNGRETGT